MKASDSFMLPLETELGEMEFECRTFSKRHIFKRTENYFVLKKEWGKDKAPLVRLESVCFFGQILNSMLCNCGWQLKDGIARIGMEGGLVIVALHQDGRGIGIVDHANAYSLQVKKGLDTVDSYIALGLKPDYRDYSGAVYILKAYYGLSQAVLLTNNKNKSDTFSKGGINVRIEPLISKNPLSTSQMRQFLAGSKMNHFLPTEYVNNLRKELAKTKA